MYQIKLGVYLEVIFYFLFIFYFLLYFWSKLYSGDGDASSSFLLSVKMVEINRRIQIKF